MSEKDKSRQEHFERINEKKETGFTLGSVLGDALKNAIKKPVQKSRHGKGFIKYKYDNGKKVVPEKKGE